MQELDTGGLARISGLERGLEAELGEFALEGAEAGAGPGAAPGVGAPDPAGLGRLGGVGAHPFGERGE